MRSRGQRFVGDHIAEYGDGDLGSLGPNLPHSWASRETAPAERVAVVVQFDLAALGRGTQAAATRGALGRLLARGRRGLAFPPPAARAFTPRLRALPREEGLRQLGHLPLLLDDLARTDGARELSSQAMVSDFASAGAHPIDAVIRFLSTRYRGRVTLAEAARVAGLSVSAFCRFFRRTTGRTFVEHVNEMRLAEACRLLAGSSRGIADIALDVGFSNLSHFNERFRRHRGMRPGDYRRAFRAWA